MARPLRIEYSGACYHVMNRGNAGLRIFRSIVDRERFLDKLGTLSEQYGVAVRAYCLMSTHFHLYIRTREPNISHFMQTFQTAVAVSHNLRHGLRGHLFQGRFKAFVVENASYGAEVSRYIHLNPGRIRRMEGVGIEERCRAVREYRWSSYGAILGLRRRPGWLDRDGVLRRWGGRLAERRQAYAEFVEQGFTADRFWDPFAVAVAQCVIGSDSFVDRMRRSLSDAIENVSARQERGQEACLRAWVPVEELIRCVARAYDAAEERLLRRHSRNNVGRQVLLYLAYRHCRGRYSLTELGDRLGGVSRGAVTRAHEITTERLKHDRRLRTQVSAIEAQLS